MRKLRCHECGQELWEDVTDRHEVATGHPFHAEPDEHREAPRLPAYIRASGPVLAPLAYLVALGALLSHPAWDATRGVAENASLLGTSIQLAATAAWFGWTASGWRRLLAGEMAARVVVFAVLGSLAMSFVWVAWDCLQRYDGNPEVFGFTGCEDAFLMSIFLFGLGTLIWTVAEASALIRAWRDNRY